MGFIYRDGMILMRFSNWHFGSILLLLTLFTTFPGQSKYSNCGYQLLMSIIYFLWHYNDECDDHFQLQNEQSLIKFLVLLDFKLAEKPSELCNAA